MKRFFAILFLFVVPLLWSSRPLALSCAFDRTPYKNRVEKVPVIAIVKTNKDVNARIMKTIMVIKGNAKDSYHYKAPLVNPIPNTCCIEIAPETEYLLFAGNENSVGYSVCGSNGLQHPITKSNGWPPSALFYAFPYMTKTRKTEVIELLSTSWPEIRAKWLEKHKRMLEALGEDWTHISSKWNPKIVEDNLDSPYLSANERKSLEAKIFLERFSEKYPTDNPEELLMLRHKNGEVSEFEYKFFRQRCEELPESGYCAIFE